MSPGFGRRARPPCARARAHTTDFPSAAPTFGACTLTPSPRADGLYTQFPPFLLQFPPATACLTFSCETCQTPSIAPHSITATTHTDRITFHPQHNITQARARPSLTSQTPAFATVLLPLCCNAFTRLFPSSKQGIKTAPPLILQQQRPNTALIARRFNSNQPHTPAPVYTANVVCMALFLYRFPTPTHTHAHNKLLWKRVAGGLRSGGRATWQNVCVGALASPHRERTDRKDGRLCTRYVTSKCTTN